jgi:hypothetical protein
MNDLFAESLGADPATLGGNIAIFVSRDTDAEHFSCLAVCKGPVRSGENWWYLEGGDKLYLVKWFACKIL